MSIQNKKIFGIQSSEGQEKLTVKIPLLGFQIIPYEIKASKSLKDKMN